MKKNKAKVGVLGFGEVGQAMAKFYENPKVKDLNRDDGLKGVEVLHICLPYIKNFPKIVEREIRNSKPELVFIHSTVMPGTTTKIISDLPKKFTKIVHSPIRGMHPDLHPGIKTFVKYIGADDAESGRTASEHLKSLGIKTKVFQPSATTEIGKLLDTSYYGFCIAWHGEMKKICDKAGVDFEKAVTDFNKTYNEGYKKLGKNNVIRPVLYPPKEGITGHCIIPNARFLKQYFSSKALDFVLDYQAKKRSK